MYLFVHLSDVFVLAEEHIETCRFNHLVFPFEDSGFCCCCMFVMGVSGVAT